MSIERCVLELKKNNNKGVSPNWNEAEISDLLPLETIQEEKDSPQTELCYRPLAALNLSL